MKTKKCYEIYARESGIPCYMERLIWATDDKAEANNAINIPQKLQQLKRRNY